MAKFNVPLSCSKWHENRFLNGILILRSSLILYKGEDFRVNAATWPELQMLRIGTGQLVNKLLIDAKNEYRSRNSKSTGA